MFKICIAMAGAVSAGAYTAGVMDYLTEALSLWQAKKEKNLSIQARRPNDYFEDPEYDASVPMHEVQIEVLAGSSAGGITASLSFIEANTHRNHSLLYDCWVNMADDNKGSTIQKMLGSEGENEINSLFNVVPIEQIADRAFENMEVRETLPPYFSPNVDLLLTVTNLEGLKYEIPFGNERSYVITQNAGFMDYRRKGASTKGFFSEIDLRVQSDRDSLKEMTLSTAAYPIGLKARQPSIHAKYLSQYTDFLFPPYVGANGEIVPYQRPKLVPPKTVQGDKYNFRAIDGGLINNEPFGLGGVVLQQKDPESYKKEKYAIIMIDPFPYQEKKEIESKVDMISIGKLLFSALRNHAFFSQTGIQDIILTQYNTRFLILPSKKETNDDPLAAGPIFGFAGFLQKSFRQHDYELGRKNCQDFLRYHFGIELGQVKKKLESEPHASAMERFVIRKMDTKEPYAYPIIPDFHEEVITEPKFPKVKETEVVDEVAQAMISRIKILIKSIDKTSTRWLVKAEMLLFQSILRKAIKKYLKEALKNFI